MFKDDRAGCDAADWDACTASAAASIRHLGLTPPMRGGAWVLPTFSAQVPLSIKPTQGTQPQMVAQFALAAHKSGFKLGNENFNTIESTLRAQLSDYLARLMPARAFELPIELRVDVIDDKLEFMGMAQAQLPLIRLKQVVMRLNKLAPGLGGELVKTISSMHQYGLVTYDPCRIEYLSTYFVTEGALTDEEMFEQRGEYDPDDVDAEQKLEELRQNYHLIPSTVARAFGGKAGEAARVGMRKMTLRSLLALSEKAKGKDKQILLAMHELKKLVAKQGRRFNLDYHDNEDGYYWIGALAFIVWEDIEVPAEIVEHAERNAYESGEAEEVIFRFRASLANKADWPRIIAAIQFYLERYAAFSKLLGLLPREE